MSRLSSGARLLHRPGDAVNTHSGRFTTDLLEGVEIDLDEILGSI